MWGRGGEGKSRQDTSAGTSMHQATCVPTGRFVSHSVSLTLVHRESWRASLPFLFPAAWGLRVSGTRSGQFRVQDFPPEDLGLQSFSGEMQVCNHFLSTFPSIFLYRSGLKQRSRKTHQNGSLEDQSRFSSRALCLGGRWWGIQAPPRRFLLLPVWHWWLEDQAGVTGHPVLLPPPTQNNLIVTRVRSYPYLKLPPSPFHRACHLEDSAHPDTPLRFQLTLLLHEADPDYLASWWKLEPQMPRGRLCECVYSVSQLCLTRCDPVDCSQPSFPVHEIFQARVLEQVTISSFRGSSWPRDRTCVFCIGRWFLYHWATWEAIDIHTLLASHAAVAP